jgi:thioredoxin reductase
MTTYDVLVVGAGPAGLSAALILARCRRSVLVCDWEKRRNAASTGIHGLLTHEGQQPADFIAAAKRDLARYATVSLRETEAVSIEPADGGFRFRCADGHEALAAKVLLATGLRDVLPDLPGIAPLYGCSVHHCLYCDGFEYSDRPIAAYGEADKGARLALMMRHWSADVVLLTGGAGPPSAAMQARLERHGIATIDKSVAALEGEGRSLRRVRFADGTALARDALFFATGCEQKSDLSRQLGCVRDEKGGVVTDALTEETSVPGVYVAGDVSRDVLLVAVAMGEGAKAGVAINRALLPADNLL